MSLVQITVLLPAGSVTTFRILVSFVFCKNEDGRPSSPMSKEEAPPGHWVDILCQLLVLVDVKMRPR